MADPAERITTPDRLPDLMTIEERLGDVRGKTIAWVGRYAC